MSAPISVEAVLAIAASDDPSTLAMHVAAAIRDRLGEDAEVVVARGERELARYGRAAAPSAFRHRERAQSSVVEIAVEAEIDDPSLAAIAKLAATRAHQQWQLAAAQTLARERQEIVAIVSHDLRTPLQSLGLGLDAIEMMIAGAPAAATSASTIARMKRSVGTMGRLLGDLLDVTRIHDGALSVHVRSCDVAKIVRELAEQHAPLAAAKNLTIETSVSGHVTVSCDASRMTQALSNFVANAIRYATKGPITIRAVARGESVRFEVSDRGPGIPADVRARLFDRLYQAQEGRRGGLGLGLYIAKGIANAHGARIGVDSEVDRGSTFWMELDPRV